MVFTKEQGRAIGGVIFIVTTRYDCIDPVIATSLKDEEHLFVPGMTIGKQVARKPERAQQIEAKCTTGQTAGFEEFASLHIHNLARCDSSVCCLIGIATVAWIKLTL